MLPKSTCFWASAQLFDLGKVAVELRRFVQYEGALKRLESLHLAAVGPALQVTFDAFDEFAAAEGDAARPLPDATLTVASQSKGYPLGMSGSKIGKRYFQHFRKCLAIND